MPKAPEYCPPPMVNIVIPEPVTVTENIPELVAEVLKGSPSFLPPKTEDKDTEADILLGCEGVTWALPPCIDDPGRNYDDDLRRLLLKMRIPGTNWDIESLRQLEATSATPISAPTLTGATSDPLAAEDAITELVKEQKALEQELEAVRIPNDAEGVDAYMVGMYRK